MAFAIGIVIESRAWSKICIPHIINPRNTLALRSKENILGRPLLPRSELRDSLEVYFSPAEREAIERQAKSSGLSLSSFIRKAALRQKVNSVPEINALAWGQLARLAGNLNQIAHHANLTGALELSPSILTELEASVQALRRDLLGIGGDHDRCR